MSRPIKEGDTISITWVNSDGSTENAEVLYMPQDTGDLMYIKTQEGKTIGINTNCSNLEAVILEE